MIVHASAEAFRMFNLKTPDQLTPANIPLAKQILDRDMGDGLREWGLDCFEFLGRSCLVLVNFASRFTIFYFGTSPEHLQNLGSIIARTLYDIYNGDIEMTACLQRMLEQDRYLVYKPIHNCRISGELNRMIIDYAAKGDRFRGYIDNNHVLHMRQINRDVNFNYPIMNKTGNSKNQYFSGSCFRDLVVARFGEQCDL